MLTELAIAGGALYVGRKFKRHQKKKKRTLFLQPGKVATNRLDIRPDTAAVATPHDLSLLRFVKYAAGYWLPYWRFLLLIIPALLIFRLYSLFFAFSLKNIIDSLLAARGSRPIILILSRLIIGFPIAATGLIVGQRMTAKVSANILNDIRLKMFEHLQRLPITFYQSNETGSILSHFSSDMDKIEEGISRRLIGGVINVLELSIVLPLSFLLDWHLALVTIITLPAMGVIVGRILPRLTASSYRLQNAKATTVQVVQETVSAPFEVKGYELQKPMIDRFQGQLVDLRGKSVEAIFLQALVESTSDLALLFNQLLVASIGTVLVLLAYISPGAMLAFLFLSSEIYNNLYYIADRVVPHMTVAMGGLQRIEDLLRQIPLLTDAAGAIDLPGMRQGIRFENVGFSYTGEQMHLHQINLAIPSGHYVALVGPTGAGKTTILNLLMRFYDPTDGRLTIDGHDLRQVTQKSLRAQMSAVFQDVFLFNTTIRENIRVSKPDATNEEIEAMAQAASIHDFIMSLPDAYDTLVGEGQGHLSAGQQQQIAIARAILRDPAILLLDEPTSSLDLETEAAILATIESLSKGHTVIFVTHRLQSVVTADRIFVLDAGQLVESGTHDGLLEQRGLYHQLWHQQGQP
ncbi:putative ABC transporter ATP-binding protein [Candidatus Entotheonellaceae bacterium PAL068K]